MLDAALIKECADPSLKPAIVEQFVQAGGSEDPLAITVESGGRLILVFKPRTPEEAIDIVRDNIGGAIVRLGLTQIPAGIGLKDASELKVDLVEPCANLRMGTVMFSKVLRIFAKYYGNPTSEEVFPQLFDDAVHACRPERSRARACSRRRIQVARSCNGQRSRVTILPKLSRVNTRKCGRKLRSNPTTLVSGSI